MNWQTLIRGDAQFVKGAEIERTIPPGFRSRFTIYSVRVIGRGVDDYGKSVMEYDVFYRVRDVEAESDAHFKAGKPAPIFGEYKTLGLALKAIEPHRVTT